MTSVNSQSGQSFVDALWEIYPPVLYSCKSMAIKSTEGPLSLPMVDMWRLLFHACALLQAPVLQLCKNARKSVYTVYRCTKKSSSFVPFPGDGSCFRVNNLHETTLELTGPDCDPVYKVVSDGSAIYTTCRDGCVRKYNAPTE